MHEKEIDRIVLDLLRQVAPEAPLDDLDAQLSFRDQFQFDSVDFLNFVLKLENETDCKISELDYPRLASLQGCRAYFTNSLTSP